MGVWEREHQISRAHRVIKCAVQGCVHIKFAGFFLRRISCGIHQFELLVTTIEARTLQAKSRSKLTQVPTDL